MGRAPCCDKANVKRGPWSPEEDETLRSYIQKHGSGGNWIALPKKAGLRRCGKSCRLRWLNYLRPDIKHGGFTEEEDNIIWSLYNKIGSRWSVIAAQLPGRTDNDIKNYWNTKLKKRMMAPQKDHQQAIITMSSPTSTTSTISTTIINTPSPSSPVAPLLIPSVKTETYTCDDFLAPTLTGLTSSSAPAGLGFGFNLDFNYQSLLLDNNNNCGFLFDELLGAFYSNSSHETKPHGCS